MCTKMRKRSFQRSVHYEPILPWLELGLGLFDSLSAVMEPLARLFAFSFSCSSSRTALLASWFLRSFSFRRALDSNSCQSPSRSLSLIRSQKMVAIQSKGVSDLLNCLPGRRLLRCEVRMFQHVSSCWALGGVIHEHCLK